MALVCYTCGIYCKNVDGYTDLLRNLHLLMEHCTLECIVECCLRTFTTNNSLRRHMRKGHYESLA